MASYGAPRTPEAPFLNSAKGDESHSYSSPMPMVLENSRSRSPRQHYVRSEKALSIVRSTRIPKKDGALVVQQLQELTGYPAKAMLAAGGTIWLPPAECTPGLEPGRRGQNHRAVRNHMHQRNRPAIQNHDAHDLPENLQPPQERRTQWDDLYRPSPIC